VGAILHVYRIFNNQGTDVTTRDKTLIEYSDSNYQIIRLAHKFCTFFLFANKGRGAHRVELLVRGGVDAEFYDESFGNKI
jgi:hypothetical protein